MNPFNIRPKQPNMNMDNIRQTYQLLMNSSNPKQLFLTMARNNPSLKPIASAIESGKNPQEIFMSICKERGIDANEFIKQITNNNTWF